MRIFRSRGERIAVVATVAISALVAVGIVLSRGGNSGEDLSAGPETSLATDDGATDGSTTVPEAPPSTTAAGQPATTLAPQPIAFGNRVT